MTDRSNQTPVIIRRMRDEDLEQVHAIDVLSFSAPWPAGSYRFELHENQAALCWVAEATTPMGKQVVGMIVVWLIMDEAHVATIAVHPDFRGQGIGRMLLTEALAESIRRGARVSTLEVRAGNLVAQALYRDFGYDVVNRRKHYYVDNGEDALLMLLPDLSPDYIAWLEEDD